MAAEQFGSTHRRGLRVVLTTLLAMALAGLSLDACKEAPRRPPKSHLEQQPDQPPAARDALLAGDAGEMQAAMTPLVAPISQAKKASLALRASRRAFSGAPPVIPHALEDEQGVDDCLECHGQGEKIEDRVAPDVPHSTAYTSCTQCHVPSARREGWPEPLQLANSFVGYHPPVAGDRPWKGAPPAIPHRLDNRTNCSSCHGTNGLPGLRTSHPERRSCRQCHAATHSEVLW